MALTARTVQQAAAPGEAQEMDSGGFWWILMDYRSAAQLEALPEPGGCSATPLSLKILLELHHLCILLLPFPSSLSPLEVE